MCRPTIVNPKTHNPRGSVSRAFMGIVLILCAGGSDLYAQSPGASGDQTVKPNYGRTPDTVIPYRNFREPYLRFFQTTATFRGSGRDVQDAQLPKTVPIGVLAPTGSAPDADLGQAMVDGIALAIDRANAGGGYKGVAFETILRQDAGAWGSTANEIAAFKYADNVVAVIGSIDGANTHIALRVALKAELPMVNTATTDPTLTETGIPWIMRCMADDRQQGYALAQYMFEKRGTKTVAAFRVNDRYGRTGIAEFRDAARRLRHPLRLELRWDRGDRDFSDQLDRIEQSRASAVVLWGNASDTAAVVREMRRRKMSQQIFGCDRLVSRRFLNEAQDAAEGVVAVASFHPTESNPCYTKFRKAFRDRFEKEPDTFAAHAYDGANILIAAIRTAGLNRVRVRDALYEYQHYDGVTGAIEFDTTLNDVGSVYIATVQDGRYVYQPAELTAPKHASRSRVPYRTMSDSPPTVRDALDSEGDSEPASIRIGCFVPLDSAGRAVARGLELAIAEEAGRNPRQEKIELLVHDSRGPWGGDPSGLTTLVADDSVVALVGSTERRGTHLMETLAAKIHLPIITLCGDDPTIHAIPLPWVFSVAPATKAPSADFKRRFEARFQTPATKNAAMGYDAGQLLINAIRAGNVTRQALQQELATSSCHDCMSGSFHFDGLGRRIDRIGAAGSVAFKQ